MEKETALYEFWSSFGLPAYEENSVYSDGDVPAFPYITYEVQTDSFGSAVYLTASLWYRSTTWEAAIKKKDEIAERIGMGGVMAQLSNGAVWIKRGSPFARCMGDGSDDMIKRVVLNVAVEYFTEN